MEIKPFSYREHARISIRHHMSSGIAKGLSGQSLEDWVREHNPFENGKGLDAFEAELYLALHPPVARTKARRHRDLPGQRTMFGIEPDPIRPKKKCG
jgi:hypothetical protein